MSFPTGSKYPPFHLHFLVAIQASKDLWEDNDTVWRAHRVTSSETIDQNQKLKSLFLWWRQKQERTKSLLI